MTNEFNDDGSAESGAAEVARIKSLCARHNELTAQLVPLERKYNLLNQITEFKSNCLIYSKVPLATETFIDFVLRDSVESLVTSSSKLLVYDAVEVKSQLAQLGREYAKMDELGLTLFQLD